MKQENGLFSESAILAKLASQKALYAPLQVVLVEAQPKCAGGYRPDAKITLAWQDRKVAFLAEVKARTAPKIVSESLWQIKNARGRADRNFLLVVPFLSQTIVELLNREGVSGIDLSGNYLIQTPGILAVRLDQKNRFPESQPIKNIFAGSSSIVGRLFLSEKKRYESVNEVFGAIRTLGGSLSLSAVSKVLKGLEDELIIEKGNKGISLLQPEKLLQRLEGGYRPPKITATIRLQLPRKGFKSFQDLSEALPPSARWVLSGQSSTDRYGITTQEEVTTAYVTDLGVWAQYESDRIYDAALNRTADSFPYFDAQTHNKLRYASPIQCYLELSKLDKREHEIAATVREAILNKLK
ncbi:MAG: hypothetical protein HZB91_11565 [Elusimicrobia bacterium]|nr:hypothetical protein [Elusimicrobiota bacterium]